MEQEEEVDAEAEEDVSSIPDQPTEDDDPSENPEPPDEMSREELRLKAYEGLEWLESNELRDGLIPMEASACTKTSGMIVLIQNLPCKILTSSTASIGRRGPKTTITGLDVFTGKKTRFLGPPNTTIFRVIDNSREAEVDFPFFLIEKN